MFRPDWSPQVRDVGSVLRSRTKDDRGDELGTFTSSTRPTGDQVEDLIDIAVVDVVDVTGAIPDTLQTQAKRIASIGAAMLVELTYWPEQVAQGRSPYDQLKEWYDARFARFQIQVTEAQAGSEPGDADTNLPMYGFPENHGGMVGWGTNW